jgi:23S rRNA (cytidine1920-2'-O)/16S rRNA (cytidine1409-2'-O)-methyltransferase
VRNISAADLPANVSFVCIDLSFISVTKVLLPLRDALLGKKDDSDAAGPEAPVDIIVLVKPQFEVGKGEVGKGGIVRDPAKRDRVLEEIKEFSHAAAYRIVGGIPSPIRGAEGNQEFLLCLQLTKGLSSTP